MVLKCIIMEQEETVIALFGANIHLKMKTHAYDFHCYALLETVAGLHGLDKCVYVNNKRIKILNAKDTVQRKVF